MAKHESISYDDVAEWWENSDYNMSTYPPSAWHAYCVAVGIDIDGLRDDPERFEDGVAELHEEGTSDD
jgi:hypothetical protein